MVVRIKHLGDREDPGIAVGGYTLMPGFTSPNISIVDGSPEHDRISQLVRDGVVELLPADPGGRDMSRSTISSTPGGIVLSRDALRAKMEIIARGNIALSNAEHERSSRAIGAGLKGSNRVRIFTADELRKFHGRPPEMPPQEVEDLPPQKYEAKKPRTLTADEVRSHGYEPPSYTETISEDEVDAKTGTTSERVQPSRIMTADEVRAMGFKPKPAPVQPEEEPVEVEPVEAEPVVREDVSEPEVEVQDAEVDLSSFTLTQLKAFAEKHDMEIPKGARKADIVALLDEWCEENDVDFTPVD